MFVPVSCSNCGHTFEVHSNDVGFAVTCPTCHASVQSTSSAVTATPPPRRDIFSEEGQLPPPRIENPPSFKLYTSGGVTLATFLGSPLGGCVLLAINYFRLGRAKAAVLSLLGGVAGTTVLIVVAMMLPDRFPVVVIAVPPLFGMYYSARHLQGKLFAEHVRKGGKASSNWGAAGIGLLCMIPVLAISMALAFVMPPFPGQCITIAPGEEIYISDGATEADAHALGNFFLQQGYFNGVDPCAVQLTRPDGTFVIRVVLELGVAAKPQTWKEYEQFRRDIIAQVFPGHNLEIHLHDEFTSFRRIVK